MSDRSRKARIVRKAEPVSEMASEVRAGLDNLADALRTLAGAICLNAAAEHSDSIPDQRDHGDAFYGYASTQFRELARKLDEKRQKQLNDYIDGICRKKR